MATRRGVLQGAAVIGGAWAVMARPWTWFRDTPLSYSPMAGLSPFRRLAQSGSVSGGSAADAVLVGLSPATPVDPALEARLRDNLTDVLWGQWSGGAPVPVTYFTDIRCPICRVLEARLAALPDITLTTREYPVFGDLSVRAARAILAATQQGQGEAMRRALLAARGLFDRDHLVGVAADLGLDTRQFAQGFDGTAVSARLAEDRALAAIFQLPGTPALIIGRTRVVGAQPMDVLEAVVRAEAA